MPDWLWALLPTDLVSAIWGAVLAALALIASGALKKTGEIAVTSAHARLFPAALEPEELPQMFEPRDYPSASCRWIEEPRVFELEQRGYTHYPHPKNGAKSFKWASRGDYRYREFLMVQAGARKIGDAGP